MTKFLQICSAEEKEQLLRFLEDGTYPDGLSKDQKRNFRIISGNFTSRDGTIFHLGSNGIRRMLVCGYENSLIVQILDTEHSIAHVGAKKMLALIKTRYYGIPNDIIYDYVKRCEVCLRYNSVQTIQPVYINDITSKYARYMMDCVDFRRYSNLNDGYCWLLNVVDTYTKYAWSIKMTDKNATSVKEELQYIFSNWGVLI